MRNLSKSLHTAVELLSIMTALTKEEKRPVSLREVIKVNDSMSLHFLEQIARKLRLANILSVVRGPGGGYILEYSCSKLVIEDLLDADILRHTAGDKEMPTFKISKSLEAAYSNHINKFKETKLTEIEGFGELKLRRS